MVCSTLERINQPEIDEGVLRSGLQTQSHLQSLLGWYLQQSNLQEQVFPFNLHFVFFFSAEIVTLLRKCMQLVIKRVLCLLMLLTAERSLKVVVSILLKNTERMEAKILNTCINQSCLQKVTTHKHNEAQKAGFKTEWFCSEICHFFLNMGD